MDDIGFRVGIEWWAADRVVSTVAHERRSSCFVAMNVSRRA